MAVFRRRFMCFSSRCGERGTLEELGVRLGVPVPEHVLLQQDVLRDDAEKSTEIPRYRLEAYAVPYERMRKRGIPDPETDAWDIRWDHRKNGLLIPVHNPDGAIVSCAWRYDSGNLRYQNQAGMPRDQLLYGLHRCKPGRPLIITEGFADTWKNWSFGYQSVSSFGAAVTSGQAALLAERGFYDTLLMYDNDAAGYEGAVRAHRVLSPLVEVRYAMAYRGVWPKDPGEADAHTINRLVSSPMSFRELLRHIQEDREYRAFKFHDFSVDRVHDFCENSVVF